MGLGERCRSGRKCVSRTPDGPALVVARPLCDGCIRDIQKCLDELPTYSELLETYKGYVPGSVGQSKVSSSAEPKAPLNLTVVDLIGQIRAVLHRADGYQVRDLITLSGGLEVALDIRDVYSKADGIIGLQRVWERRRVPCPECALPTLGGWVGEDRIYCTNADCGTTLTKAQYEEYCEMKSKEKVKRG
ncbi:hypothetical protein SEA_ENCELADUS_78 [Mycobacterium phage Enceladus]|uniref:Uncharacterized protein n=2 Tax=Bronvirus TaxID=1623278 RepID=A0A5Q2WCU0_9CAUD|nr:DNA binding protein [Mycobacterium phage CicholasNage]YP_010105480.1 DNA binding protein [Mycobacterium phage DirkDirk]AEZ50758.1 hypothetical protein [Mycobacterium phage Fezzik]AZS12235.1 hypothetical protein SEA_ACQUIRE49_81 [Mycobacterium phage Acquire49]QGJ93100.1 hypothetical protein SEA_ZARIA_82 [Mycobacterium phage Zaria]UEM46364.1 hypothetical protein SEA_ENCELADUS_78 [Mycobacterium phage Enceladus]QAY03535.1 hypothetical protein SEA_CICHOLASNAGE_78 [Mycobacterium phage CicholasNa